MWAERGIADVSGVTIAEVFARHGVPLIRADDTRVPGWQRVREYLAGEKPRLQVFSTCANLIRTLPAMTYDRYRMEDMGDGLEDHACESLRYGIMSRPRPVSAARAERREAPFDPLDTREKRGRRL